MGVSIERFFNYVYGAFSSMEQAKLGLYFDGEIVKAIVA
jgi:hypothetical protein